MEWPLSWLPEQMTSAGAASWGSKLVEASWLKHVGWSELSCACGRGETGRKHCATRPTEGGALRKLTPLGAQHTHSTRGGWQRQKEGRTVSGNAEAHVVPVHVRAVRCEDGQLKFVHGGGRVPVCAHNRHSQSPQLDAKLWGQGGGEGLRSRRVQGARRPRREEEVCVHGLGAHALTRLDQ